MLLLASLMAVTFDQAGPVLERHCLSCHHRAGIAPMAFETYAQTRPWAKAIREKVLTRRMPPWFAAQSSVEFANDARLTAGEIASITEWVDNGAQPGSRTALRVPVTNHFAPDLIVRAPRPARIAANAVLDYQYLVLPLPGAETDRWVNRVEVRPSEPSVVHHVVAYIRERDAEWLKDAPRGVLHVPPPKDRFTKADILAVYTPGARAVQLPAGFAKKLPAGAELVLQFHYTARADRAAADQTSVALGFAKPEAVTKRVLTLQMGADDIEIPPGERRHRLSVSGTLPNDALLLSLMPHMHLRGSEFEFEIVAGGGRVERLLHVKPFDFHWQLTYWLRQPMPLKAGTRLRFTGTFDNSPNNPRNPDPRATVTWGEQSWQEMMIGFFDVAVDPRAGKPEFFTRPPAR